MRKLRRPWCWIVGHNFKNTLGFCRRCGWWPRERMDRHRRWWDR